MRNPIMPLFALLFIVFVIDKQSLMPRMVEAKSNVHIVYLGDKQNDDNKLVVDSHHQMLAEIVGSKEEASKLMVYNYKHSFSGFAAKLTDSQAQQLSEFPGVVRVIRNRILSLKTTRSWDFLGLSSHSPNLLHTSNMGEGVIVGLLDTGLWPESKAFSDEGLGPIPSHWKGGSESGDQFKATIHCNRKIIGARWFIDGFLAEYGESFNKSEVHEFFSPRDAIGHGTHTSSTAAGSLVHNVSYNDLGFGTIRGGAPRARLAMYKVCWNVNRGQCASADILKAFDEAIHDGVDVISLSIAGQNPLFSEVDEYNGIAIGSFHAVAKGITVVCAAGNEGPSAETVKNTAPWIITVAASTIDRSFPAPITLGNNETLVGQGIFTEKEIDFTGLVYAEETRLRVASEGESQNPPLDASLVAGKVVLIFPSPYHRLPNATKFVKAAGAVGIIFARTPDDTLLPCDNDFPCIEVDFNIGTKILLYARSTRSPVVKLSPVKTFVGQPLSANVAYFLSRGPNSIAPAILKPDIAAPGVNIIAASSPLGQYFDNGFDMLTGTSMATPHVSGIVALLKSAHPDWSPAAIKSALVTTAWKNGPSGSPIFAHGASQKLADPFDLGGGVVNPNKAAVPGLVYDMTTADYIHYLCAMSYINSAISRLTGKPTLCPGKKPSILDVNVPSVTIPSLSNCTTLTRTVTNVGEATKTIYKAAIEPPLGIMVSVNPEVLVFDAATKKISYRVTVSKTYQVNTGFFFGSLTWTNGVHAVRIPISVKTEIMPA
ncbi:hypothetical protein LWI29_025166 [Acer saccharum]|uniref:Uncharacterized protein n=1 Tax=Acer saccharum TaxID=4024 RepID=A0AA39RJB5_ACESA|nr:hypothetical protein LWI29_025166 [Acer saccharum]